MKNRKKLTAIAKVMFKESLKDGYLNQSRFHKVLKAAASQPWPNLAKILKIYKTYLAKALTKEEVLVESSTLISKTYEKAILTKTGAKRIKYKINSNIIAGAKITHGDWIWDASLKEKLEQLTSNI